ncbi:unnamed protein product [Didymodactylos carnosus]|uniref:Uncharacterized protein n=1 Tax=Didymodactylos carnosus TaxID=1234261 RepID=A0A814ENL2_9BILA|nr:unnamed protein product [Didymodactylos carnosus]CAF0970425.1 unnamed protein product [Didymodactylos carnosus]CAF3516651.1 unnamed protein product [Didymodactylos carnosus]CAF3743542.1 unnamed protein product [Didymodactylos carnosus]
MVAFESGCLSSSKYLIFIGGLTDGLNSLSYLETLSEMLESFGYCLIQILLRSCYLQYGFHSLQTDLEDLDSLIEKLVQERGQPTSLILMGHSTGCQDIIYFLKHSSNKQHVTHAILQGPVSDREFGATESKTEDILKYCRSSSSLSPNDWIPHHLSDVPITISRFLSLNEKNSIEDVFSTDLTNDELSNIYSSIRTPLTWIFSIKDQYVPDSSVISAFAKRLVNELRHDTVLFLSNADHGITSKDDQQLLIEHIKKILK